jgi:hypothetical protein
MVLAFAAVAILATGAWSWPEDSRTPAAESSADCQFVIRASNNLSFDVWVNLYDSSVTLDGIGILGRSTQLKIQNHRIRSGGTMDRRYTAPGGCARKRNWVMRVRTGSQQKIVFVNTEGTSSTSRTVDLGPSSQWGR